MNAFALPAADAATAATSPSLAAHAARPISTPLTRVSLAYVEHRIKLYLRFGEPARTLRLAKAQVELDSVLHVGQRNARQRR